VSAAATAPETPIHEYPAVIVGAGGAGLRAAIRTVQPSAASTSAQARPMPFEPPVTSARLPLRFRSISRQSSNMPQITTDDGVKLHYEEAGSGTPVVFVHEFAGDLRSWDPQLSHFSRRYRCIAYNARGYPPSDVPESFERYSQDRARDDVLAVMPTMYDDLWTAGKGMYKSEPVVADDGEVIIYAPHVTEVSRTHGRMIEEVGYHCRDYFLAQWDRFKKYPGGILAHSTHVKGNGTYDAATDVETPRVQVTLATGISKERSALVNLGYKDPKTVDRRDYEGDPKTLVIPRAGEMLYRVKST